MQFLAIHPGALGDTILSLPALLILRRCYPDAELTLAGNTDFTGAVVPAYADRLLSFSALPLSRLYRSEPLSFREASFWNSYDRIVSWTGSGHPEFVRNFEAVRPGALVVPWRPGPEETRHVSRIFVESLYSWIPVQESISPPTIPVPPEACLECRRWLDARGWIKGTGMVALHVGAGSKEKRWPARHFQTLAARLLDLDPNRRIVILEGPAEPMLGKSVAEGLPDSRVQVAQDLALSPLVGVLHRCSAFVGSDSGVAHLSAALGVPTVSIFGPTLPQIWAPLGRSVHILRGPGGCIEEISPDEVLDAMKAMVPLSP